MRATATFEITGWDQSEWDESTSGKLARARVTKQFSGEVEGTSVAEVLTAETSVGPAAYAAQERFTGSLGGRSGSFIAQHGRDRGRQPVRLGDRHRLGERRPRGPDGHRRAGRRPRRRPPHHVRVRASRLIRPGAGSCDRRGPRREGGRRGRGRQRPHRGTEDLQGRQIRMTG